MSKATRKAKGVMPRVLTREQITKLADHNLIDYRKVVLDRKQQIEERYTTSADKAKLTPDGPYIRGRNQKWDEGGWTPVGDITDGNDLDKHRALTYLAHATDEEMRKREIGGYGSLADEERARVDDPDSVTWRREGVGFFGQGQHAPLRPQREGHRKGRRKPRGEPS